MNKKIIGIIEKVSLIGRNEKKKDMLAKIDTGASRSSIDTRIASELKLGPIVKTRLIKSANGSSLRPVIEAKIRIDGQTLDTQFTLANRKHMKYKVLIGLNTLQKGDFLVDPEKNKCKR